MPSTMHRSVHSTREAISLAETHLILMADRRDRGIFGPAGAGLYYLNADIYETRAFQLAGQSLFRWQGFCKPKPR